MYKVTLAKPVAYTWTFRLPHAFLHLHPHSLTVVGETCFAETHEQMLLYFA